MRALILHKTHVSTPNLNSSDVSRLNQPFIYISGPSPNSKKITDKLNSLRMGWSSSSVRQTPLNSVFEVHAERWKQHVATPKRPHGMLNLVFMHRTSNVEVSIQKAPPESAHNLVTRSFTFLGQYLPTIYVDSMERNHWRSASSWLAQLFIDWSLIRGQRRLDWTFTYSYFYIHP